MESPRKPQKPTVWCVCVCVCVCVLCVCVCVCVCLLFYLIMIEGVFPIKYVCFFFVCLQLWARLQYGSTC